MTAGSRQRQSLAGIPAGNWLLIGITHLNGKLQTQSSANRLSSRDALLTCAQRN